MNQKPKHTEPNQYLYDSKTWLYRFMHAFYYGFGHSYNYIYDIKFPRLANILALNSYTYDALGQSSTQAFGNMDYEYDYFSNVKTSITQYTYSTISVARRGVFLKHTVSELETGFDYFGARYLPYRQAGYASDLSIWLSVDPLSDMYPSTSPYMYVLGRPTALIDPNGMNAWIPPTDGSGTWTAEVGDSPGSLAVDAGISQSAAEGIVRDYNKANNNTRSSPTMVYKDDMVNVPSTQDQSAGLTGPVQSSDITPTTPTLNNQNISYSEMLDMAIPVAISVEGSGSTEVGVASSATPYGGIFIFRGKDAFSYTGFTAANVGVGWFGASATISQTTYLYFGDLSNFGVNSFSGTSFQGQISGGEILIGGGHFNVVRDVNGGFLFGVGADIGFGIGSPISGQVTWQTTKLHKE